jgi:glyoxylase-like metal-dependent hydrolase (beta-lactamase superfamily II)
MNLFTVETGKFKLDGGAMFGVVPKSIWTRTNPSDERNLCSWSMRSLLIEDGNRKILVDTGIGDKQGEDFFKHYHLHGDGSLESSLMNIGIHPNEITDVLLTHLHFDHVGGAVIKDKNERLVPRFKNATYWSNENHWNWAVNPNDREKASFLLENLLPLEASEQLQFIKNGNELGEHIELLIVNGHTEAQMIPKIKYKGKIIVFMADLIPSIGHIPIPYIPSYDTRPLLSLGEKKSFLDDALKKDYYLFMQHDPIHEVCTVKETPKGARLAETYNLSDIV